MRSGRGHRLEAVRLAEIGRMVIDEVPIKDMKLADVTSDLLGRWRDQRLTVDKVLGSSVNRDLNLLSHVFRTVAKEWKWIASSPTGYVRRPKDPPPRDHLYTDDEIDRLCFALGFDPGGIEHGETVRQRVAVAFLFAIETAMRSGEICGLMPQISPAAWPRCTGQRTASRYFPRHPPPRNNAFGQEAEHP